MANSVEKELQRLEANLRRVASLPGIAGGAPMSAEFLLSRINDVVSGWSPSAGGGISQDDVDLSAAQNFRIHSEVKGWPPMWPVNTDLVAMAAWFADVGTPSTSATLIAVSGEAGLDEKFENAIKVVTASANEGFQQTWTYADEPRIKAGYYFPDLYFWVGATAGGADVSPILTDSGGDTAAEKLATDGDWDLYVIRNHLCAGTSVSLQVTKDTAGTFYTVFVGQRPQTDQIYTGSTPAETLDGEVSKAVGDVDLSSLVSPLTTLVYLTLEAYESTAPSGHVFFARPKGSSWDTTGFPPPSQAVMAETNDTGAARVIQQGTCIVDDKGIIQTALFLYKGSSAITRCGLSVRGWRQWA